jgi:hypothetical protein
VRETTAGEGPKGGGSEEEGMSEGPSVEREVRSESLAQRIEGEEAADGEKGGELHGVSSAEGLAGGERSSARPPGGCRRSFGTRVV